MKWFFSFLIFASTVGAWGQIELPYYNAKSRAVIYNDAGRYTYAYSAHRIALWVAYKLTKDDVGGDAGRASSFKVDAELEKRGLVSATNADYYKSGYDKGHLLPSADRSASVVENRATFLFSNVAPQAPNLNRVTWRLLEEHIRRQTKLCDTIYVVCGAVMQPPIITIGSGVGVPNLFFKAYLTRKGDKYKTFAYVMRNVDTLRSDFNAYAVSVDSVERLTKLKLFYKLSRNPKK